MHWTNAHNLSVYSNRQIYFIAQVEKIAKPTDILMPGIVFDNIQTFKKY